MRLKHRLDLEHVTGLSQLAVLQDFAAKVVCDNLQALTVAASHAQAGLPQTHRINRAYAHTALKPLLPALLLDKAIARQLQQPMDLIAGAIYRHRPGASQTCRHTGR
jgi:hypothetical protein